MMHDQTQDLLDGWLAAQKGFWSEAARTGPSPDAHAFSPSDWQVFDGLAVQLVDALCAGQQSDRCIPVVQAAAAYRDVIAAAWGRIRRDFDLHRRAIHDPARPAPDWRLLRDRWFQIAEAEFIQTQRSEDFLTAQRDLIRAAARAWADIPAPMRAVARDNRLAAQAAATTLGKLGIDGVAIAETPKDIVWSEGRTTLSRYRPLSGDIGSLGPVLICHGLIGRQTMTDLRPDRSLVRNLLSLGVDVFVADWGDAGPDDASLGLDHFAGRQMSNLISQTRNTSGADGVVLFGICQGGTLAACNAARFGEELSGLILGVAPIDFHADAYDADPSHGLLNLWVRSLDREDIDALVGMEGNLSGLVMGTVFNQLNPVRTLAKYAIDMLEQAPQSGDLVNFLAMEKWLADRPDLPGALAKTWLADLYKDNALVAGNLPLMGASVDLGQIGVPVLNLFATNDHIIPPPCSRAIGPLLTIAPYQELALPTGHIGAFVSARSQTLLAPAIVSWLQRLN